MESKNENTVSKVTKFLSNKTVTVGIIACLAILLLNQYNSAQNAKAEALREHNNLLASQDSVRVIRKDRDLAIFEKSSFQLKVSELSKDQKDLISQLELSKNGKGTTPKTVIEIVTEYKDSVRNIASTINKDPNGQESISFVHNPQLPGKNKLKISGKIPYELGLNQDSADSTKYTSFLKSGLVSLDIEQSIDIVTGIYQDPKSKRIMTRVSTTYPGMNFSDINSFDITDNPETRRALKTARKEFGFGFTLGYGFVPGAAGPGLMVGVGLHYTPKFLQFGK
jgi:hypothetical protein